MEITLLTADKVNEKNQNQVEALFNQLNSELKQRPLKEVLHPSNNIVFAICTENDTIIGMAAMVTYHVISAQKGMIEDVVVDNQQRGKGIGRKLMNQLLEEAEAIGLDEVLLFSGHHRKPAIALYTSLGFVLKNSGLYRLILG